MFKPGIWRREDLFTSGTWMGRARQEAYTLLRCGTPASAADVDAFEEAIRHVRLASGVYRTTYRGRFAALDAEVAGLVRTHLGSLRVVRAHDWAVSDGLTSLEWASSLRGVTDSLRVTASDYILELVEASENDRETYVAEPSGAVVQYVNPPFVLPMGHQEPLVYLANRLMKWRAQRRVGAMQDAMRGLECDETRDVVEQELDGWTLRPLALIHPDVRDFARVNDWFDVRRHDAFDPLREPCDVLRTMNLYNRGYFPQDQLERGIRAAMDSVVVGGLWIVGRTNETDRKGEHHVTVFRRGDRTWEIVARLGRGSEVEELVPLR